MAQEATHEHAHAHVTNTGIDNRKLGFWIFLSSEAVFFACLLIAYLVYHGHPGDPGPRPMDVFNIPLTSISTFVLLMSSLSMVIAVNSAQRGKSKEAMRWTLATALMGLVFLGGQVYEFSHFVSEGLTLSSSLFGTTFFVLTGFHGTHVLVGVIWLFSLLYHGKNGGLTVEKAADVEIAGLYWHFVDVVWIVLFTVIYLMEAAH
jgi:heme/copper-type cytochrome/quinol oxidase subunit 3